MKIKLRKIITMFISTIIMITSMTTNVFANTVIETDEIGRAHV